MSITSYKAEPTQVDAYKGLSKRIMNRQILHPIFDAAANYTNDEFWKHKLICAARNKFPRNYYFRDGFLINRKRSKTTTIKIPDDDPGEALRVFVGFMNDRGIISDMDAQSHRSIADFNLDMEESVSPALWTAVPNKMKNNYITDYVTKNTKGMSPESIQSLYIAINLGIKMKIFDKNTITMGDFSIVHIKGLMYDINSDRFYIDKQVWESAYQTFKSSKVNYPSISSLDEPVKPFNVQHPDFESSWCKKLSVYTKMSNKGPVRNPKFMFSDVQMAQAENHQIRSNRLIIN